MAGTVHGFTDEGWRQYQKMMRREIRRARHADVRSGRWHKKGSGGGEEIVFRPVDVCEGIGFTCDCVLAEVITSSCNSGVAVGDEVNVWDINRCYLQLPAEKLYISNGFASWMKIHESEVNRPPGLTGNCRWVVTGMCCVEAE